MAELTPEQQAAGIFVDASGNLTNPDGTPVMNLGMGAPVQQVQPPPPPTPSGGDLTQRMIDAGATFFDQSGIPTRPDGTPALYENRPEGVLEAIRRGGAGSDPSNVDSAYGYGFGPGYTPTARDYPSDRTPLAPPIWTGASSGPMTSAGVPEQSGLPPGALDYSSGAPWPTNWQDFVSGDRSSGGGFFTAADWFGGADRIPGAFTLDANLPSTNNWRLIPGGRPGMIVRNGFLIDMLDANSMFGPQGLGSMGYSPPGWRSGAGAGVPVAYAASPVSANVLGWPGQQSGWLTTATTGS